MKKFALAILLLCFAHGLHAQSVTFTAKASKANMAVNDTISVVFMMNADGENFQPPKFGNFDIVAGPSQQVSQIWMKGEKALSKQYKYVLRAKNVGNAEIGKASIDHKRKTYWSAPIFIEVKKFVETIADKKPSDSAFIKLEGIPEKMRVNDTIKLAYKFYFPERIGIGSWKTSSQAYENFEVLKFEAPTITVTSEEVNEQKYRWAILHKIVLIPKTSGVLKIEPRTFTFAAEIPNGKRDFFGKALTDKKTITVTTEARQITVAP